MMQPPLKTYTGIVRHGLANGRKFGYPTANIGDIVPIWSEGNGVFAAYVQANGEHNPAMLYAGTRPTLHLTEPTIEIHLLDFHQDLYGQTISFQIKEKIREERQFTSTEELIRQLQMDEAKVREILQLTSERPYSE